MAHHTAHAADQDEIVPGGNLLLRATVLQESQREAIAVDGQRRPLVDYLVQKPGVHKVLSGGVTRNVTTTETLVTYGLSDSWNLQLTLPYLIIQQSGSPKAEGGGGSAALAEDQLKSETVSGLGNVRLMSLHRPLFSDTDAIVLGWGWMEPGAEQTHDYIGRGTLGTSVPYQALLGLFHYTAYPLSVDHARFDIRLTFDLGLSATVKTPADEKATLQGPNTSGVSVSWRQEYERFGYEVALNHTATTPTFIEAINQHDQTRETRFATELLYGNLRDLEEKPIDWPYVLGFRIDYLLYGFNVPDAVRWGLFAKTYF